nr:type I toxin-antitoxin system ptaRNA1 family toxin [Amphritea pacifica]
MAALEFIDQETARQISPVAEAVANMFTILYYQAETGRHECSTLSAGGRAGISHLRCGGL